MRQENRTREISSQGSSSEGTTLIGRRTALKAIGVAAIPLAAQSVQADSSSGYGDSGYGAGYYGGDSAGEDEDDYAGVPELVSFEVGEESPPNPHADLYVEWAVSEPVSELEEISIDVYDIGGSIEHVDSESIAVDGSADTGEETIRISHGSGSTYRVAFTVSNSTGGEADVESDVQVE
ncbi:hypothetical protein ACLI4Q_18110 [Natrialbaceae archaeon A-CW1-1]